MKKWLTYGAPLLCAVAGVAALRYWQRLSAFEDTGLVTPHAPATWCLVGLVVLSAVGFFLLGRLLLSPDGRRVQGGRAFSSYLASFALPHRALMAVYLLSGGLLVAAGLLGIGAARMGLADHLSYKVLSVALVPTGLSLALVGWVNAQRQEAQGRFAWPLLLPGWCGCVWVISAYQSHTAQPGLMAYALYLLGAVCAVGACYMIASFSFERPRPLWTAWLCAMALILLATAAVDGYLLQDTQQLLVSLGYMVYLATQLKCLLYRAQVSADLEPWVPSEEVKTEVSEDE